MKLRLFRLVTSASSLGLVKGQLQYITEGECDCCAVSGGPEERAKEFTEREGIPTILIPGDGGGMDLPRASSGLFGDRIALRDLHRLYAVAAEDYGANHLCLCY